MTNGSTSNRLFVTLRPHWVSNSLLCLSNGSAYLSHVTEFLSFVIEPIAEHTIHAIIHMNTDSYIISKHTFNVYKLNVFLNACKINIYAMRLLKIGLFY